MIEEEDDDKNYDTTNKDIKKGMDRYEEKINSGEAPEGDSTKSDE
jgi:hypothetical protein